VKRSESADHFCSAAWQFCSYDVSERGLSKLDYIESWKLKALAIETPNFSESLNHRRAHLENGGGRSA
jgi:hypothetical protein